MSPFEQFVKSVCEEKLPYSEARSSLVDLMPWLNHAEVLLQPTFLNNLNSDQLDRLTNIAYLMALKACPCLSSPSRSQTTEGVIAIGDQILKDAAKAFFAEQLDSNYVWSPTIYRPC